MTTRYVGTGGNDSNSGLTWALRKLTLNGVEDSPVQAGDTVYVGPGTYRETLTVDVSGTAGNVITYIGDYDGSHTDGVGGVVRISGSNDDKVITRAEGITNNAKNYRTFTGFLIDNHSGSPVNITSSTELIFTKIILNNNANAFRVYGTSSNITINNCVFLFGYTGSTAGIYFTHTSTVDNSGNVVSNCIFMQSRTAAVAFQRVGGVTIKNCSFFSCEHGAFIITALSVGQTITVNNCVFDGCYRGVQATTLGEITEDYNNFGNTGTARINVATGANSLSYPTLVDVRWVFELAAGGKIMSPFDLASYSQLINVAGTTPTTTDMRGTTVQGTQREWGALEYDSTLRQRIPGRIIGG